MLKRLLSTEAKPGAFFRRIDWTAFWCATAISFIVYFLTLGPSVGLEDSGELATAADHLGVPHPPGYPFWTMCGWVFCRAFSWVTYMGHPTPAWALSLFSAVTGAFAAGCMAMLICRSGSDMLDSMGADAQERVPPASDVEEGVPPADAERRHALMGFAGGLGGALVFAFSPVEWSQSTIVEIYSLNALFLIAVFLLAYRWMRRPSDKVLWLMAFVFGLGLTNYQVLLMAAVPLALIILLRDVRIFRDLLLVLIPLALTAHVLQIGALSRADAGADADVINKFEPVLTSASCPNGTLLWIAFALVVAAPVAGALLAAVMRKRGAGLCGALGTGGSGLVLIALASTLFTGEVTWTNPEFAPRIAPSTYAGAALLLAAAGVLSLGAAFAPSEARLLDRRVWPWLAGSGACALGAFTVAALIPAAGDGGYAGEPFSWTGPMFVLLAGVLLLAGLSLLTPRQRGLAFAIPVAAVQVVAFTLLRKGALNGLTHPTTWWFFWPCIWNFMALALAVVTLPNGRSIGPALLFAELGVSFYAYMPIVSDLRNPPMNWGCPRTWEGFKRVIMRGQYDRITMPPCILTTDGFEMFCGQVCSYIRDLRVQFTFVVSALALIPFTLWKCVVQTRRRAFSRSSAGLAAGLYAALAAILVARPFFRNGDVPCQLDAILLVALAILSGIGVYFILRRQLSALFDRVLPRSPARHAVCLALFAVLAVVPTALALFFFNILHLVTVLAAFGLSAVFAVESAIQLLALFKRRPCIGVRPLVDDVAQQWLIAVGACLAIMSLFLTALAYVTGDVQDGFIQKVKFISSHAMLSLWIGYGLMVGVVAANRLAARLTANLRARRAAFGVLCVLAACTGLVPFYGNYANDRLVFTLGAAEQNGHSFGWQFGNYELRGASAIREELSSDEEPLPNPLWPEEMGPSAIFFGGTDPGRFVPTYMIYSAKVRPDVHIISQNPLADHTYASVERDLYGDEIWIPSDDDIRQAFDAGTSNKMEINGILARKMFQHERLRRDFYIEESLVIRWMYDYLTPHGLIMKIGKDRVEDPAMIEPDVRNDMEFWDWYARRLLKDPAYRRDFAAQTSFSKLRAAIAGLYANIRNRSKDISDAKMFHERSATAYREAVALYPAFPEVTFRYIQEVLILTGKWNAVLDIADYMDRVDPENGCLREFKKNALLVARETTSESDREKAVKYFHNMSLLGYSASSNSPVLQRLTNGKDPL